MLNSAAPDRAANRAPGDRRDAARRGWLRAGIFAARTAAGNPPARRESLVDTDSQSRHLAVINHFLPQGTLYLVDVRGSVTRVACGDSQV